MNYNFLIKSLLEVLLMQTVHLWNLLDLCPLLLVHNTRSDDSKAPVLLLTEAAKDWAAKHVIISLVFQGFFHQLCILALSLNSIPAEEEFTSSSTQKPAGTGCTHCHAGLGRRRAWFPASCVLEFEMLMCQGKNKILQRRNGKREDMLLCAGLCDLQEEITTWNWSNLYIFVGVVLLVTSGKGLIACCVSQLGRGKGWVGGNFSSVKVAFCFEAATVIFHVLFGVFCF